MTGRNLWPYPFPLEDGTLAEIHLPPDLSRHEADRLTRFIAALVYEPDLAAAMEDRCPICDREEDACLTCGREDCPTIWPPFRKAASASHPQD